MSSSGYNSEVISSKNSNPRKHEIELLHKFFIQWFKAEIPQTRDNFLPFTQSLSIESPVFALISPSGKRTQAPDLIDELYDLHACRRSDDSFTIWIENVNEIELGSTITTSSQAQSLSQRRLWMMEYEEHQIVEGKHTKRLSTALLRERKIDRNSFNGSKLEWVRVHETWVPID